MAEVILTIKLTEATAQRVEKALCERFNVEVSGPNTKAIIMEWVKRTVIDYERQQTAISPVEGIS
jgi:hypothetical protein